MLIKFYRVYEPGEFQDPILQLDEAVNVDLRHLPNYKDTVVRNNIKYYVHDIIHEVSEFGETSKSYVHAYRKIDNLEG